MRYSPQWPDDVLDALSRFLVGSDSIGDVLLWIVNRSCRNSPADMAGITLLVEGEVRTGVSTQPAAREIDEAQYVSGRGPCLDAFRYRRVGRIDATGEETPWPEFCRTAAAHGIGSTLSLPVVAHDETVGVLNLYARGSAAFDLESADELETVVALAAIVLTSALMCWGTGHLAESLCEAMRTRRTINHAIGILMARSQHSPHEALQLLVRASQRENRELRYVAEEIVDRAAGGGVRVDPLLPLMWLLSGMARLTEVDFGVPHRGMQSGHLTLRTQG